MGKFLENLPIGEKDIEDLREVLNLTINQDEDFNKFTSLKKVRNNDPVAFIGDGNDVGTAGAGCDPTYVDYGVVNSQKRWALGDWQVPLKICYESLKTTIAEYSLKSGTQIGDLTSGDFMDYIIRPTLDRQLRRMIWRFAWFGDTKAANIADGGVLKAGVDKTLFTTCDGLFKKIFAQCTTNTSQLTSIAANAATTYAAQKAAILTSGAATSIMDNMLMDADSRISSDPSAVVFMTKGLADALSLDIKEKYKQIMPWQTIFDGLDMATYDGVTIVRASIWDRMIRAYENTGTVLNKPYRAVFTNINQMQVGTDADSLISDLDVFFDRKERRNYIYATGKIGTQILEDDMFQAAY